MKKSDQYDWDIDFYERVLRRNPQDTAALELLGSLYTRKGRISDGLRVDRKLVRLMPDNPTAHYNLACSLALKRRKADAVKALRDAIELGYEDLDWMCEDPDLECLHGYPAFNRLLEDAEGEIS